MLNRWHAQVADSCTGRPFEETILEQQARCGTALPPDVPGWLPGQLPPGSAAPPPNGLAPLCRVTGPSSSAAPPPDVPGWP